MQLALPLPSFFSNRSQLVLLPTLLFVTSHSVHTPKLMNNIATSRIRNWNGRYPSATYLFTLIRTSATYTLATSSASPSVTITTSSTMRLLITTLDAVMLARLTDSCSVFSDKAQASRTDAAKAEVVRRQSKSRPSKYFVPVDPELPYRLQHSNKTANPNRKQVNGNFKNGQPVSETCLSVGDNELSTASRILLAIRLAPLTSTLPTVAPSWPATSSLRY